MSNIFGLDVDFSQTKSSYIDKNPQGSKKGVSILGRVPLLFVLLFASLLLLLYIDQGSSSSISFFAVDFIVFGALFIVVGWLEFSLTQTIKDIPTIKIDAAAAGLTEVNAAFVPEKDSELVSLMSKQKCVFYRIDLQEYVHAGKSRSWEAYRSASEGISAMLTDGTGYLAIDLSDADTDFAARCYYPTNSKGQEIRSGMPEGKMLYDAFDNGATLNNFSNIGVTFSANEGGVFGVNMFGGDPMRIVETVIPTNSQFFAIGRISDVVGKLGDKPVKIMSYDPSTKLLSVQRGSKAGIEKTDSKLTFVSFGIGILLLVWGLMFFRII